MATEVINSYNILIDTERNLNAQSDGDSILLSLNQTPITCSDNQYIRLTLQSFSMYKSFTNCNPNNNILRFSSTDYGGTADAAVLLEPGNYSTRYNLAFEFASKLGAALSAFSGVGLAALPTAEIKPPLAAQVTDNIIQFRIDFTAPHGFTDLAIRFLVSDGDIFELLGGDRIRPSDPPTAASVDVDLAPASAPAPANSIIVTCKYNAQLSTQQNVYLRTDINNTNIQTESFNAGDTDNQGSNSLGSSRILGRMIIDNEFVSFTTGTQMEYFVNLTTKNLTFLRLYITDSHGRKIPQNVKYDITPGPTQNTPLTPPVKQLTLGNRSWEGVIKCDVVQYMGGQNNVLQGPAPVYTVPARFGTEPLNKLDYGESGYPDPDYRNKIGNMSKMTIN